MAQVDKPLVWLHGEVKTPPFTQSARIEAGYLLRRMQAGDLPGMPHVRPMPEVAAHCYELRIRDRQQNWRILVRIDDDAIVIVEVFSKGTRTTPQEVVETCRARLRRYDEV
jgi:phage-related protein